MPLLHPQTVRKLFSNYVWISITNFMVLPRVWNKVESPFQAKLDWSINKGASMLRLTFVTAHIHKFLLIAMIYTTFFIISGKKIPTPRGVVEKKCKMYNHIHLKRYPLSYLVRIIIGWTVGGTKVYIEQHFISTPWFSIGVEKNSKLTSQLVSLRTQLALGPLTSRAEPS